VTPARRRPAGALRALAELERIQAEFGPERPDRAARKAELLARLAHARLGGPAPVLRLHEAACFLAAYPDDARVLALAERLLDGFEARPDLRAARAALADSGVAGTEIRYPFFAGTARWLARQWGDQLHIDWDEMRAAAGASGGASLDESLERLLSLIAHHAETPGLDELDLGLRGWLSRMAGRGTGAALLALGVDALEASDEVREYLYERLGLWLRLAPGRGPGGRPTPSRTRARWRGAPIVFQTRPLRRERPDLARVLQERPVAVRELPPPEAQALIDLAREAMVVRSRDLDVTALLAEAAARSLVVAHVPPLEAGSRPAHVLVGSESDLPPAFLADPWAAGREIASLALRLVVVTRGERGAEAFGANEHESVSAPHVRVVDSTAAGDVFAAGLVHALAEGRKTRAALETAVAWGAAAVACPGVPSRETIQGLL